MPKQGKRFSAASEPIDASASYEPLQALELVKAGARAKFDETVEANYRLGIDSRHADQNVRGTVSLPHGTGRSIRVAVFATGEKAKEAEDAGADIVGGKELAEAIQGGRDLDFDMTIATPDLMSEVGKVGKILGPRGLMPNPKAGTVTFDIAKTVAEFKAGKIEYRNDKAGNVHGVIGKASFEVEQLVANLAAFTDEITRARPAAAKGRFIRNLSVASTMGPGVRVDLSHIDELAKLAH
jgi:large subunit ribosomal protein L1